jgi:hypothetical protein
MLIADRPHRITIARGGGPICGADNDGDRRRAIGYFAIVICSDFVVVVAVSG